jgi:hypothetical protein
MITFLLVIWQRKYDKRQDFDDENENLYKKGSRNFEVISREYLICKIKKKQIKIFIFNFRI